MLSEIRKFMPDTFRSYYEPFMGGAAVLFSLDYQRAVAGDLNEELINVYRMVKENVEALIESLARHHHDKEYYYEVRAQDPKQLTDLERAGRLIFLNKTCFNGLYRVNSKGQFNVPFGSYKKPLICDPANLRAVHARLQDIKLIHGDYREVAAKARKGDFVYFDPPYVPLSNSSNFTKYAKDDFDEDDQKELAEFYTELAGRGVYCMLSNSSVPLIRELYRDFKINVVRATRAINSVGSARGKIDEVLITSY